MKWTLNGKNKSIKNDDVVTLAFNKGECKISINRKTRKIIIKSSNINSFMYFPSIIFTNIPDTEKRTIFKYYIHSVVLKTIMIEGKVYKDLTTGKIKEFIDCSYDFFMNYSNENTDNGDSNNTLERVVKL